jgi:hypothetical protein
MAIARNNPAGLIVDSFVVNLEGSEWLITWHSRTGIRNERRIPRGDRDGLRQLFGAWAPTSVHYGGGVTGTAAAELEAELEAIGN